MTLEDITTHLAAMLDASTGPDDVGYLDASATGNTIALTYTHDEGGPETHYRLEVTEL